MKIKFNHYERVAGLFVLTAIFGCIASLVGVAIEKGWFEDKVPFETVLATADGIRAGTQVQMAGLRIGSVTKIELRGDDEVHVIFEISEKFHDRLGRDTIVRVVRPFIIGEKVLDLSVGTPTAQKLAAKSILTAEPTADIMDLVSGRTLAPHLETLGKMTENLRVVAEMILDPKRSREIVKIFDELAPLVGNMNAMSREVTSLLKDANKDKKLVRVVSNLATTTDELNKIMPALAEVLPLLAKDSPQLAADLSKIAHNMALLTDEVQSAMPAMREIGPELPRASRRAIEALDETVVTLKALQKSFLLRGSVKDVRDEEAARSDIRQPANETKATSEESRK